jgi:hypothetical protein
LTELFQDLAPQFAAIAEHGNVNLQKTASADLTETA